MNGVKMNDCRFYVNEEERTVVCVIPNTGDMVRNFIEEHFRWGDLDFGFAMSYNFIEQKLRMPHSFSGKAVCAPEDEWDVEFGKKIAFSKAKNKCYRSFFRRANMFVRNIDTRLGDIINLFNDFGEKLDKKSKALQKEIDDRLGITEK